MRQKSIFAAFFLLVFMLMVVYSIEKEPHKFSSSKCPECHLVDSSDNVVKGRMTASVSMLCRNCHENLFEEGYIHPVDVRPQNVRIPADMPLSNYGYLTCNTCHDIHSAYLTPYGTKTHYLRRYEDGKRFCEICHTKSLKRERGHEAMLGEAHFQSKYIMTHPSQEIDPLSKNCVSCHDGSYSTSPTIMAGTWQHSKEFIRYDKGRHPIGVDYESARAMRGRKTDLKPIGMVDRRIRFFNGRVGCGSCHDPYSTIEKRLVMSDEQSRLCLACHLIDKR